MLWSRIIVASNTAYDQCSDSNNLKLQRLRSVASSLRKRFGKISSRRESYPADPEPLQRFGRLFSLLDSFESLSCAHCTPFAEFAPQPVPLSSARSNILIIRAQLRTKAIEQIDTRVQSKGGPRQRRLEHSRSRKSSSGIRDADRSGQTLNF